MDQGMPLRDKSTYNYDIQRFDEEPTKNAHDKAHKTDPNPTDPFPSYDYFEDHEKWWNKNMFKNIH